MYMIGHSVYSQHLVLIFLNDAGNVFIQFVLPPMLNNALPVLNGKNYLDVNLCVGVRHGYFVATGRIKFVFICLPAYGPQPDAGASRYRL